MADDASGRKTAGLATTAVVVLLLSLMGAGVGFALGIFLQPGTEADAPAPQAEAPAKSKDVPQHESAAAEGEEAKPESPEPEPAGDEDVAEIDLKIIPIPPVLTTLAEPQGKWVRLEGSILAKPGGEQTPELLAERAGEQILAYLRTVRLEQIQGPSGLLALRDDLNETVKTLSGGQVQSLLIHGLLVE